MQNGSLSEALLAEWRQQYSEPHNSFPDDKWQYIAIIRALLAEVERLRKENDGLAQLGAAKIFYSFPGCEREKRMYAIVQAVARGEAVWYDAEGQHCGFCDVLMDETHAAGCLVTQARVCLPSEDA